MKDKREQNKQKGKLGAKSKIKLKNYVKTNKGIKTDKGNKRFKQVHNESEVNKAMAELSDGNTKEVKESSIQELENDIQEVLDETNGIDGIEDEIDFKERPKAPEPRLIKEGLSDEDYNMSKKSFRDKFLAGAVIGGLLALAFVDVFFNK